MTRNPTSHSVLALASTPSLSHANALQNDGDVSTTVDVLAQQVGVLGIFSDWSGTVSYYASCFDLR